MHRPARKKNNRGLQGTHRNTAGAVNVAASSFSDIATCYAII